MGLSLPDELTTPMSWIGLEWPQADEDLLADAGQQWIKFGNQLSSAAEPVNQTAQQVWTATEGDAATAFQDWWTRDDGPDRRLSDDAKAALLIGGALLAFAAITLTVKLSIIAQLVSLAALVGQAVVTAFFTFGATTAEIPGFVAASRVLIRQLIHRLVTHVQSEVRAILDRAKALLRRGQSIQLSRRSPFGGPPRSWSSSDPHVGDAANAIEREWPGWIRSGDQPGEPNRMIPMKDGFGREVDIDLDGDIAVQVKKGKARGLTGQMEKTMTTTNRRVVGYAPDAMPDSAWQNAAEKGLPIARTEDELIKILRELR